MREVWVKSIKGLTAIVLYNSTKVTPISEEWRLMRVSEQNYNRIKKMKNIQYSDVNPNYSTDKVKMKSLRLKGFELDTYDLELEIGKYGYVHILPIPRDIELSDKHHFVVSSENEMIANVELNNSKIIVKGMSKGYTKININLGVWSNTISIKVL